MDPNLLQDLVKAALKSGADAAEAVGAERRSLSIGVRLGALEEVEREEVAEIGLRVFVGQRTAVVAGSNLSSEARARLVERAVAMARLAPEDRFSGLAPPERLARGPFPDLDLFDPSEPEAADLESLALAAEEVARATPGVANSEGGGASWADSGWTFVTSTGFEGRQRASSFSLSASVIAGEGDKMERGGEGRTTRHRSDLPTPEAIGAEAGRRAVGRLNPRTLASQSAPVIFENRLAMSVLSPMIGAISGAAVARGVSFLKDKLGSALFTPDITISEAPHRIRGLGSGAFDDEGVATTARKLIDRGALTTWLMNVASANQLGLETTGHASRGLAGAPGVATHNLTLEPGTDDLAALMRGAGRGLLVTSMFGPSLNSNTGDWSVGVGGFWFEEGEVAYPVSGVTVAGNLIDIYGRLVAGSDLELRGSANAPSILVDALAIAGK